MKPASCQLSFSGAVIFVSTVQSPSGGVWRMRFWIGPLLAPLMSASNVVIASLPSATSRLLDFQPLILSQRQPSRASPSNSSSNAGSAGGSSGVIRNQSNAAVLFSASTSPAATGPILAPVLSGPVPMSVNDVPSSE